MKPGRASWVGIATALALGVPLLMGATATTAASSARAPEVALDKLADRLATEIAREKAESPVALMVRGESPELGRAFATVLAAELARRNLPSFTVEAQAPAAAELEAREKAARTLVRVTLSLENGLLHARGDLLGTWVNFWSGAAATRPAFPAAGLEASTEADAHALALAAVTLPTSTPTATEPQTGEVKLLGGVFARLPKWTAALAAGDLDGDGKEEVVVLTDDEVLAFAPDGKLLARREHRVLPSSPTPAREPFGALAVLGQPGRVAYVSAQRARGEQLALEGGRGGFRVLGLIDDAPFAQAPNAPLSGKLNPGLNTFAPKIAVGSSAEISVPRPFTTAAAFVGPSGTELLVVFPDGGALWRRGLEAQAATAELRGLGAASALADVDGDGTPEIVTSEAAFSPEPEVLRVLRAPSLGASTEAVRFRKELQRGRALQITGVDLDGDLSDEVIAAIWLPDGTTELQVYRRAR